MMESYIIALNKECKELGFKRGDVFFKVRDKLYKNGVSVFSSNYTLYADISPRMNLIYYRFTPDVEIYSMVEVLFLLLLICLQKTSNTAECWEMKREFLSPEYTTKISDVPKVK